MGKDHALNVNLRVN